MLYIVIYGLPCISEYNDHIGIPTVCVISLLKAILTNYTAVAFTLCLKGLSRPDNGVNSEAHAPRFDISVVWSRCVEG